MAVQDSNDGITNFILTAISRGVTGISTSNMATITAISDDKTMLDVTIDTTKEEIDDVPFITLQGGGDYLQFPIAIGDKCLIIFAKDSNEDWLSGADELVYASDFSLNNGFALVGINNTAGVITLQDYTELKVSNKIKISNDTDDMVTLLSDTIAELSGVISQLTGAAVMGPAFGGPLNPAVITTLTASKVQVDALKVKFDNFKV